MTSSSVPNLVALFVKIYKEQLIQNVVIIPAYQLSNTHIEFEDKINKLKKESQI